MKENDLPLGVSRLIRNYGAYSVLVAGFVTVWSWAGWNFPFVMAKDYAVDKKGIETRLGAIETALARVSINQLEAQETVLSGRVQDLDRALLTVKPGDPLRSLLESQKIDAERSLARVRRLLNEKGDQ